MNLNEINLSDLDINNIGSWPMPAKLVLVALLFVAVLAGGYYLFTADMMASLDQEEAKERSLKQEFEDVQNKVRNLPAYKAQLADMERSFDALLRQLPDKTEVADLLVDISQTGLASGLEFELFEPSGEVPKDFYYELPIKIRVRGSYHEFGDFISGVSALPRIVTLHDIKIKPAEKGNKGSDGGALVMDVLARTYRAVDEQAAEGE